VVWWCVDPHSQSFHHTILSLSLSSAISLSIIIIINIITYYLLFLHCHNVWWTHTLGPPTSPVKME